MFVRLYKEMDELAQTLADEQPLPSHFNCAVAQISQQSLSGRFQ